VEEDRDVRLGVTYRSGGSAGLEYSRLASAARPPSLPSRELSKRASAKSAARRT